MQVLVLSDLHIITLKTPYELASVDVLESYKYQPRYDVLTTCSSNYLEVECLFVWFVLGVFRQAFAERAPAVRA